MTRENLLQAIYDNEDDWSCQYTCPHTMEEENPQDVCMKCAEKQLKEYEDKIRADAIDDCKTILKSHHMFRTCEDDYNAKIEAPFYKRLWKSFEQLKGQNNGV